VTPMHLLHSDNRGRRYVTTSTIVTSKALLWQAPGWLRAHSVYVAWPGLAVLGR